MYSLKVLKKKFTFPQAVQQAIDFKQPFVHSDERLYSAYADTARRYEAISNGLRTLCQKHLDVAIDPPPLNAVGAHVAAGEYHDTRDYLEERVRKAVAGLTASLDVPQIGRIEWFDDETCRFTYFDVIRDRGILQNTVRRIAHTHDLVKARQHRLPAEEVELPRRAAQIIQAIPQVLHPYVRIITGLEVQKVEREHSRRQEATWLGQAVQGAARTAAAAGQATSEFAQSTAQWVSSAVSSEEFQAAAPKVAAGVGAVALGGALLAGLYAAGTALIAAAPLAVVDPAIVIGELCLFGWED